MGNQRELSKRFKDETIPLFLLTIFEKGEKENLSKAERNEQIYMT